MKKVLLAVVSILFAATSFAQNALVASLSHGTDVTYFYGVTALQQAMTKAASGDIINLSGGSFNATDIGVGITLRGAGIDSGEPTYIVGNFTINIPSEDANRFMMEGIRCSNTMATSGTFSNPYFVKCQFNSISNGRDNDAVTNIMFANCKITGNINVGASDTYSFVNCLVNGLWQYQAATATLSNCVLVRDGYDLLGYGQFQLFNCILVSYDNKGRYKIPNNSQATNCIAVNFPENYNPFEDLLVQTNCQTNLAYADVFKTFTGTYSDEETYELTDAGKAILGTDNTQVGLYGGLQPYSSTPSYPLISSMTVPAKTDDQGKMDVTVTVSNPTE